MKSFLKYTFATFTGIILVIVLLFMLFMVLILASSGEKSIDVKNNSVLYIQLNNEIQDRAPSSPMENFNLMTLTPEAIMGLDELLNSIEYAKTDDRIMGIYLEPDWIRTGIATKEEIRNALIDFRESGKFILSYSSYYPQSTYYVATVADRIYINPAGVIEFLGLRAEILFYYKAFEKWGIEAQVFRYGKYKSAVEPFLQEKLSDENRLQISTLLNSVWKDYLQGISEERNITGTKLNCMADSLAIRTADDALKQGLVDGLRYKDEMISELMDSLNVDDIKDFHFVRLPQYIKAIRAHENKISRKNKIAVIYASGALVMGEQDEGSIASETISRAIRNARIDSTIKAIVLRVNSGGGIVLAAEIIWRELKLASEVKPVIASMGDYAASGGYYIVACADTIVASPNTITGSIGVFAILLNTGKLLEDRIGVTYDYVNTNAHSNLESVLKPLDGEERNYIQSGVDYFYNVFIGRVAEGRNMSTEEVDSISQGRVWSGQDALDNQLVDVMGGLKTAIDIAARKAGLETFQIVSLPEQEDPFTAILRQLTEETRTRVLKNELGEYYEGYRLLKDIMNYQGFQARMPYHLQIN